MRNKKKHTDTECGREQNKGSGKEMFTQRYKLE